MNRYFQVYFPSFPPLASSLESQRIAKDNIPGVGTVIEEFFTREVQSPIVILLNIPPHA